MTNKEKQLLVETHDKWLRKGNVLARLFAKSVAKSVETDGDIQKAVADADKVLEKARIDIEKQLNGDKDAIKSAIPSDVRKYLGFDY
jgi:hypothetical protein